MSISKEALKENVRSWERLGPIADGGTIFGLALSPNLDVHRYWAATSCGIFLSDDDGNTWAQNLNGLTTPLLSAIGVAPNGALFAGSLEGELFSSFDYGKTWQTAIIPLELKFTVTAILPSPNFRSDGAAFAATDGGGVMVTRSSGKSWEESSFGLGSANVLALAAPPDWSRREIMFLANTEGVFISTNGGRSWRETELILTDDVVDVLAVSPAFEGDHTLYAGTEGGKLYCSTDGGRTWELLQAQIGEGSLNCLWLLPDFAESGRMVAGIGPTIYISNDRGDSWREAAELPGAILTLTGEGNRVLAGLYDAGVTKSEDGGATWASLPGGLSARGFARLFVSGDKLYAMGPQEGLWASEDEGRTWHSLSSLAPYLPISSAFVLAKGLFVASQQNGILRSTDGGSSWETVCQTPNVQSLTLLPDEHLGWAGTSEGKLLATQDGGSTWQEAESPCAGEEILSIVASPLHAQDRTLLMGTASRATPTKSARVALWRSTNGGASWRQVTTQVTTARWVDIALPFGVTENATEQAVLATGPYCLRPLRRAKDVWISTQVDPSGANALSVVAQGEVDRGGILFAATGSGVYRSIDGGRTWHSFAEGLGPGSFISLTLVRKGEMDTLYALSLGGSIWKRELA